jgi:hypothetical protein
VRFGGIVKRLTIAIVCLTATAVTTAGFIYGRRVVSARAARPDNAQALFAMLPKQAPYVVYVDVTQLRSSALLQASGGSLFGADAPTDPDYLSFIRATGFDFTKDLDRFAAAIFPTKPNPEIWAIAKGRFDREKIDAYSKKQEGKQENLNGSKVIAIPGSSPDTEITVSFLGPNLIQLVSGPRAAVETPLDPNAEGVTKLLSDAGGAAIFGAMRGDALASSASTAANSSGANAAIIAQGMEMVRGIQLITISGTPEGENLRLSLEGKCDTAQHAAQLGMGLQMVRALAASGAAQSSVNDPKAAEAAAAASKLLGNLEVQQHDQSVVLTLLLTPDILHQLSNIPSEKQGASTGTQQPRAKAAAPASH